MDQDSILVQLAPPMLWRHTENKEPQNENMCIMLLCNWRTTHLFGNMKCRTQVRVKEKKSTCGHGRYSCSRSKKPENIQNSFYIFKRKICTLSFRSFWASGVLVEFSRLPCILSSISNALHTLISCLSRLWKMSPFEYLLISSVALINCTRSSPLAMWRFMISCPRKGEQSASCTFVSVISWRPFARATTGQAKFGEMAIWEHQD